MSDVSDSTGNAAPIDIESLSKALRTGNTQLHHQIVAKKESLNKQAKKQRAIARYNWHAVARYLKKRVVSRDVTAHQEEKNKKLDVRTNAAVDKLCSAIRFGQADCELGKITKKLFEPLNFYKQPTSVPIVEEAADEACERFIDNFKLDDLLGKIAPKFVQPVENIDTYERIRPTAKELQNEADEVVDDVANDVFEDIVEKTVVEPIGPKVFSQAATIYSFSQDSMILNPVNDVDKIISQVAQNSVLFIPFTSGLPHVSKECRKPLRSLGRYAYPAFDNEEPLDIERPVTIDETDLNLAIETAVEKIVNDSMPSTTMTRTQDRTEPSNKTTMFDKFTQKKKPERQESVTARDINIEVSQEKVAKDIEKQIRGRRGVKGNMFYYDLSSILQGLDDGLEAMVKPIPNLVMNKCIFSRDLVLEEISKPTNSIASGIANDPEQVIPDNSLSFIDDEINESLKEFVASGTGITEAYEDLLNFNLKAAEQAVLSTLASMTFSRMKEVTPFLIGAANIKVHKVDEEAGDNGSKTMRKKKHANPVFATIE